MVRAFFLLLLFPVFCFADNISLSFHKVPIIDFAEATYRGMLDKDYVVAPSVIEMDKRITIAVKSIDRSKLPEFLADILSNVGVSVREVGGIIRLDKVAQVEASALAFTDPTKMQAGLRGAAANGVRKEEPEEFEVYWPENRTAEYLSSVLRSSGLSAGAAAQGGQQNSAGAQDAVVVAGSEERREKVLKLLRALDRRPVYMNVRAALIEFTDTKDDSSSFGSVVDLLGGKLSLSLNSSVVPSDSFVRFKSVGIDAVLKSLNGDSRFRFRTQPTMRLVDGEKGRLMVGSEVPIRGALTLSKDGTPLQSTEYRSSGLVLTVQPRALKGHFTAVVSQEVSSFAVTTTSNIDSPTLNKRQIEATVDADDGELVVLAGLDEETASTGSSGFSWLPFKISNTASSRRTRLFVLLEFCRL